MAAQWSTASARDAIHETTTLRSQGRNPLTSTAVQVNHRPAVLDFEITQLDRYTDYLKIATQRHWLRVHGQRGLRLGTDRC
jgi:hypothetical protein